MTSLYLDDDEDVFVVTCEFNQKELIRQIPGSRWNGALKKWTLPKTWASIVTMRGYFPDVMLFESVLNYAWSEHRARVEPSYAIRELLSYDDSEGVLDERLYPYQVAGAHWLNVAGHALLADEMGTGKTIQTLMALRLRQDSLPALVICPNTVKIPWADAVNDWLPEATAYAVHGTAGERKKILADARNDPNAIVIMNIESVRLFSRLAPYGSLRLRRCASCDTAHGEHSIKVSQCEVHQKELNTFGFKTVILDEAHRVKDPKSKQTRACWAVGHDPRVTQRIALTGTPLANHPGDLWSIFHFLTPDEFPSRVRFVNRYCLQSWSTFGGLNIVGVNPQTAVEMGKIINPRMRRVTKDLVLKQLPPKIRTRHLVDMTTKQAKAYHELDDSMITKLDDGSLLVSSSNLTAAIRHIQLASAYLHVEKIDDNDPSTWTYRMCDPSPKLDAMMELLDDIDGSVAIAAESRQLIDLAEQRLAKANISNVKITGHVSHIERQVALRDFQSGKARVMLFTIKAGGTGLTMTAAGTMIFLQRSWSMVDNLQAEDRVHRIGSEIHDAINYIDIVCRNTIEEGQIKRLYEKSHRLEEIVQDRARRIANGLDVTEMDIEAEKIRNSFLGIP